MTDLIDSIAHEVADEAREIRRIRLVRADGRDLPSAEPGAHIDVHMGKGLVRQYSLCNSPGDRAGYTIAVQREAGSRGGSAWMHDELAQGTPVLISPPRNNFSLVSEAAQYVLLAGGIGITPIFAMAQALANRVAQFQLHYFARSVEHVAFRKALESPPLAAATRLHTGLSGDETALHLDGILASIKADKLAHVYFCGPQPFLEAVLARTESWNPNRVHFERFTNANPDDATASGEFHVELARSGGRFVVPPDKSIVEVLRDNGIVVDTACEEGVCGTCVTKVISGAVDHRDVVLSPEDTEEQGLMAICVSRAKSGTIVLDL